MKYKILMVDDDKEHFEDAAYFFDPDLYDFHLEQDPSKAVEIAKKLSPDAIIMDIGFADLSAPFDGFVVIHRLQNNPTTAHIPLLVYSSAGSHEETRLQSLKLDIVHIVEKGRLRELQARLEKLLKPKDEAPAVKLFHKDGHTLEVIGTGTKVSVRVNGEVRPLNPDQICVLDYLANRSQLGHYTHTEELVRCLYRDFKKESDWRSPDNPGRLWVLIHHLRERLKPYPLENQRNVGYRFPSYQEPDRTLPKP